MLAKYLAVIVSGLLIQLIALGLCQSQSPCPDVFQYAKDPTTGNIDGYIELRDIPKDVIVYIMIKLSVAIPLPTKYVGKLELVSSKEQAIENVRQSWPLLYRVRFPIQHPLPIVTRILLNGQERCTGRRAIGQIVTTITLEHALIPSGVVPQPQDPSIDLPSSVLYPVQTPSSYPVQNPPPSSYPAQNPQSFPTQIYPHYPTRPVVPFTKPTQSTQSVTWPQSNPDVTQNGAFPTIDWNALPIPDATLGPIPNKIAGSETSLKPFGTDVPQEFGNCGQPRKSVINLLISKGDKTQPGDWPWLVAIFVSRIKLQFQCAGSLISNKHVLTAAHCFKSSGGPALPASTLLVVVGRYKLRGWTERGSVTHEVLDYKLHHKYGQTTAFGDDLAVITLMETVTFGQLIMPICLWSGRPDIQSVVGKTGFVVGWGRDEEGNPLTDEPRMSKVPIVSQEECLRSDADFVEITSERTFCGGTRNGSGPCNGDSGAGLVMYDSQKQRYHLRGVVSLSLLDRNTGACDLSQFVVYTDVAKYLDWIRQQIVS